MKSQDPTNKHLTPKVTIGDPHGQKSLPLQPNSSYRQEKNDPAVIARRGWRNLKSKRYAGILLAVVVLIGLGTHYKLIFESPTASTAGATITADFANRTNTVHPIPTRFGQAGADGVQQVPPAVSSYLKDANMTGASYIARLADVFPTQSSLTTASQQNWSTFDNIVGIIQKYVGSHPNLFLEGTPAWLQPQNQTPAQTNYCLSDPTRQNAPYNAFPVHTTSSGDDGLQLYAQMVAATVAHIDKTFPGLQPYYEVHNEPDNPHGWCEQITNTGADDTYRYNAYLKEFLAVAPAIRAQAKTDGVPVKVGGPALAYPVGRLDTWIKPLLATANYASQLDYVTYHQYGEGQSWDGATGVTTLAYMTDPQTGYKAIFERASQYIRQSANPNILIYLGEYNCNSYCGQDKVYAPLFHSLMLEQYLAAVVDSASPYGAAQNVIAGTYYWGWSFAAGNMCMFGTSASSCANSPPPLVPHNQYYSYQLYGSSKYLEMANNGYVMAAPAITNGSGLYSAAFTSGTGTGSKDNLVVVNTSGQAYTGLSYSIKNPGSVSGTSANIYTIGGGNGPIVSSTAALSGSGNSYSATFNVPAYSTVAVSIMLAGTPPPPTVTLTAAPTTISRGGASTLTWSSTNVTSCIATGSWNGAKATNGSESVSPSATATYTLTCSGSAGSANQSVVVTVSSGGGVPGDCNGDGHVNVTDMSLLLSHYGTAYASCDFNNDGIVDVKDLSILLSHFGT